MLKDSSETNDKFSKRLSENQEEIKRVDKEIRDFFAKPMSRTVSAAEAVEMAGSIKDGGPESINWSFSDIEELKNRFKRLQYDTNRSINSIREEVKDKIEEKLMKIQFNMMNTKQPRGSLLNPSSSKNPLKNKNLSSDANLMMPAHNA